MGVVFHIGFFSRINSAAFLFGALFVIQAALFAAVAASRGLPPPVWHGARALAARALFVIPALWSLVGLSAALQLGMWEDLGLAGAGVITLVVVRSMPVEPATALRTAA